jgi:hypothetical protein
MKTPKVQTLVTLPFSKWMAFHSCFFLVEVILIIGYNKICISYQYNKKYFRGHSKKAEKCFHQSIATIHCKFGRFLRITNRVLD